MRYSIPLVAGVPQKQFFSGRCIAIIGTGAAPEVSLTVYGTNVQDGEDFGGCGRNFSIYYPDRMFSGVELTAAVDTTVEIIVANANVQTLDGANLTARIDAAQLPLPVQTQGVTPTNRSGTIAVGATSQQAMAANAARRGLWVQNLSTVDALWLRDGAAASAGQPSVKIAPGAMYETPAGGCPVTAIHILGPTAGQAFSAREW